MLGEGHSCHLSLVYHPASPEASELITLTQRVPTPFPLPWEVTLQASTLPISGHRLDSPGSLSMRG